MSPLTIEAYRDAMARLSAAVNVITTDGPAGRGGFTASAVCSVTDRPPTLLVCQNRASRQHAVFAENGVLCVNTLGPGHETISSMFAGVGDVPLAERFPEAHWTSLTTGAPALREAIVSFDCRITDRRDVSTHTVLFCEVVDLRVRPEAPGLVYFRRVYRTVDVALDPPA
ncbi:flavin reductase [Arboricoccus pini]|uniref:Flavin reductase n=1 Tax=Arboricoccus pini TaxID=1963835 RepID=A0A212QQR8_9PROT|nr:flavin reductase [Arboricoccus pini]SNB61686.1 flavin reductase [Arboricoccus pini]